MRTYDILLHKIDAFTRKYYTNRIIKGVIYFVSISLASLLLSALLEYFGRFSSAIRMTLFFALLGIFVFLFLRFIAIPFAKLMRLGRLISVDEASRMIGAHFPEVRDKLLNTLQLQKQSDTLLTSSDLLLASIDQRIASLSPVDFSSAINFGENKKYLRYVLPPMILAILLWLVAPAILTDGTKRIVDYNAEYLAEAPFAFVLSQQKLEVAENDDFLLEVHTNGQYAPSTVNLILGGKSFRMKRSADGTFGYRFRNVRNNVPFKFSAEGYESKNFILKMLPMPAVIKFDVELNFPPYLKRDTEYESNTGNLRIPEGTTISWKFATKNTKTVYMGFRDSSILLKPQSNETFSFYKRSLFSERYEVSAHNDIAGASDTIAYSLDVIKDEYPRITLETSTDSINERQTYFGGSISDDHGLRKLVFHYIIIPASGDSEEHFESIEISQSSAQEFYHFKDFTPMAVAPGDVVEYYFEVWDNDGVNGSKSSTSERGSFAAPSSESLENEKKQSDQEIKDNLQKSIKDAADLKKEFAELNKDLLQKKEMGWQEKKKIENLLKKQSRLQKNIESMKNERLKSQRKQENYMQQNEDIIQKQRQLEKMFDELMSDEMKEMYEQLEELMKQLDQEKLREELEKMDISNDDLEKELDRTLEIFKQMEFEQNFDKSIEKLEELAQKQEDLAKTSNTTDKPSNELKEEQDNLNEEFDEVKKELDDLKKQNDALERPNDLPDIKDSEKKIEDEMQNSSEELEQNNQKKAEKSQNSAAEEMKEMAAQMKAAMSSSQSESAQEDMEDLRALLENIIQLSFDQERIMETLKLMERDDPSYVALGQAQKKLEDDSKMVEDSLFALSKRVVQIESIVNKEISSINQNIAATIDEMGERMTANATVKQQYIMTSYNNLALLLDEALQQMQMAMANEMPGKGNCEKPGGMGSKPSEGKMSKMQEAMGKKLEQMQKALEEGKKPGEGKPGMGSQGMSQEIAQMAAEQAAIRKEIEKIAQQLNEQGKGEGKGLQEIAEKMEQNEKDLVNQNVNRQTLQRQEDILSRLLQSEKAEREREFDEKRESNSPDNFEHSNPQKYLEYNKRKAKEIELLRTVPNELKPYYKDRVNDYFLNFEN